VTQFEHPREITADSTEATDRLIRAGVVLINQAIVLKGVNDDPIIMAELHSKLVKAGIGPYYVFQCRPVKRVKRRFQVPLKQGYKIVEGAKAMLDGPSKRFRYVMSHRSGKIEILGIAGDEIYLKYHQARDPGNLGKFFKRRLVPDAGWLDDLPRIAQQS
jgi:L-lysine 2,3-aminomutase